MNKKVFISLGASLFFSLAIAQEVPQLGKAPIEQVVKAMTTEEKITLLMGTGMAGFDGSTAVVGETHLIVPGAAGTTAPISRLGIPAIVVADGPAGLRIAPERKGDSNTYYCTAFPVGTLIASSWNMELAENVGKAMGKEVLEYGVDVLLAPALNIQRNPLCGRNFEYYSEDPLISGKITAAMVRGVQSNGVGTSIKHFAANNQETNRTANDARITTRALREIYLKGFEIAVKESEPWTVMSSYNYINNVYTSESRELLTTILRDEWGFKGIVMTDWFGGANYPAQVHAGNDLLMPGHPGQSKDITEALANGTLSMEDIDRNVTRILELILASPRFKGYNYSNKPDLKAHAEVTRQSAAEGMVLLKNEEKTLPLSSSIKNIAVFGTTSYDFISGGTGSGDVNNAYTVSLVEGLENTGYQLDPEVITLYENYRKTEEAKRTKHENPFLAFFDQSRIAEFIPEKALLKQKAKETDIALITIGRSSGEFTDRTLDGDFLLTPEEKGLIKHVTEAFKEEGKKTVVILNIGGVIETASWKDIPDAILLAWQAGQEGGNTVADILSGKVNPSGKLTMTFPVHYMDAASSANFPYDFRPDMQSLLSNMMGGPKDKKSVQNVDYTNYEEDIFVGYRWFDTFGKQVSYPFGYGLSYTTFEYSSPAISESNGEYTLSVTITNKGSKAGKEVVQAYISAPAAGFMIKPEKELKAFTKTRQLQPGESQTVSMTFTSRDLASFHEQESSWITDEGIYKVQLGASSRDIRARTTFEVKNKYIEKVNDVLKPQEKIQTYPTLSQMASVVSPETNADGSITFRLSAPEANEVKLRGDWMNGFINTLPMHKNQEGIWEITTEPLETEMYQYAFYVDGVKTLDPSNLQVVRDGTRVENMVIVPGKQTELYMEATDKKGTLSKVWYYSQAYGGNRRMYVYTPHGYESSKQKYPVLYLQHGGGGDEDAWTTLGRTVQIMDHLIGQGKAEPMIVVMPNANPYQMASPDIIAPLSLGRISMDDPQFLKGGKYVETIAGDIIPFIEKTYRVKPGKKNRAIAGLSMGGIYTLSMTAEHPELFDYIGVLSMGYTPQQDPAAMLAPVKKAGYKLYWVGCGKSDFAYDNAERLLNGLNDMQMEHTFFDEVGGHTWATWRICLKELAPLLFK